MTAVSCRPFFVGTRASYLFRMKTGARIRLSHFETGPPKITVSKSKSSRLEVPKLRRHPTPSPEPFRMSCWSPSTILALVAAVFAVLALNTGHVDAKRKLIPFLSIVLENFGTTATISLCFRNKNLRLNEISCIFFLLKSASQQKSY